MNWKDIVAGIVAKQWQGFLVGIAAGAAAMVWILGSIYGGDSISNFNISGDLISVGGKPVARFEQKFEMLENAVIRLPNGQVVTFFVPSVHVEYTDRTKEPIKLPRAPIKKVVDALQSAVNQRPGLFKGGELVRVAPCPCKKQS